MAKWMWIASVAAIAMTAPALAGQDKGKGGGQEQKGGGGQEQKGGGGQEQKGGGGKAERGSAKAERGGGKAERQEARAERGNGGQRMERQDKRDERGNGKGDRKAERQDGKSKMDRKGDREVRFDRQNDREVRVDKRGLRDTRNDDRRFADRRSVGYDNIRSLSGLFDRCPPGLARKNNGCLPPGQAKKLIGSALPAAIGSRTLDGAYRQWYRDNDQFYYRNDDDYIYRVRREGGLIDSLFPFQDADYSYYPVGTNFPSDYDQYNVPFQYQSYFADGNDYNYRYGDGAIYQVNRSDNEINSIVALLAGDLGVGQQIPSNYGVYNVPMAYRDRYYDTPDATYRYNDGYIYQADAKTQLITAVIDAIV